MQDIRGAAIKRVDILADGASVSWAAAPPRGGISFLGLDDVLQNGIDPFSPAGAEAMRAEILFDSFTEQSKVYGHVQWDAGNVFGAGESIALVGAE